LGHALALAPTSPQVLFDAASVYNHLGDTPQALAWLKKAMDAGYSKSAVTGNPDFDRLQNNPQFRALVSK